MEAGKKIRVLVVDDSAFMRKVLGEIIASEPQLDVCGEAKNGKEAIAQAEALKPRRRTGSRRRRRSDASAC